MTSPGKGQQLLCPHDDAPLEATGETGRDTPPWWCRSCSRLWWRVQLTAEARAAWDRTLHGYPPGRRGAATVAAMLAERTAKPTRRRS